MRREFDQIHFDEHEAPTGIENPLPVKNIDGALAMLAVNLSNHARMCEITDDPDTHAHLNDLATREYVAMEGLIRIKSQIGQEDADVARFANELDGFQDLRDLDQE